MAKRSTATKSRKTKAKAKTPAGKTKRSAGKKAARKKRPAAQHEVTIDRRQNSDRRNQGGESGTAAAPKLERRKKVNRRRQIDPTTCERDYSPDEVEFMNALNDYKRTSGRMFPTCSEVLEVLRSIGYVKLSPAEMAAREAANPTEQGTLEAESLSPLAAEEDMAEEEDLTEEAFAPELAASMS